MTEHTHTVRVKGLYQLSLCTVSSNTVCQGTPTSPAATLPTVQWPFSFPAFCFVLYAIRYIHYLEIEPKVNSTKAMSLWREAKKPCNVMVLTQSLFLNYSEN